MTKSEIKRNSPFTWEWIIYDVPYGAMSYGITATRFGAWIARWIALRYWKKLAREAMEGKE